MIRPAPRYQAIVDLHDRGYSEDFQLVRNGILWVQQKMVLPLSEFSIINCSRIDADKLGRQEKIILGVLLISQSVKGILICHYSGCPPCWRNTLQEEIPILVFAEELQKSSPRFFKNNLSLKSN